MSRSFAAARPTKSRQMECPLAESERRPLIHRQPKTWAVSTTPADRASSFLHGAPSIRSPPPANLVPFPTWSIGRGTRIEVRDPSFLFQLGLGRTKGDGVPRAGTRRVGPEEQLNLRRGDLDLLPVQGGLAGFGDAEEHGSLERGVVDPHPHQQIDARGSQRRDD